MTDTTTTPKRRTITLTDRPPVRIDEADWPVVATAEDDDWDRYRDYGRHQQAIGHGEATIQSLRVRQHADGRALVYGVIRVGRGGGHDWRGGELLPAGADLAAAIRRVGETGALSAHVIAECVADLPAEELL